MTRNVYAHTPPGASYPEFISVNQQGQDNYSITVRGSKTEDGSEGPMATITLSEDQARSLAVALLQDVTAEAG